MIKDMFNWYLQICEDWKQENANLVSDDFFVSKIYDINRGFVHFKNNHYFVKTPHSRSFKLGYVNTSLTGQDNKIATASELIAEKKYKSFNFMTAVHQPIYKENYGYDEYFEPYGIFTLVSPMLFTTEIHHASISDFIEQEKLFNPASHLDTAVFGNLGTILKRKKLLLEYMTEECYDEFVQFMLLSIFEFSDDDHMGNVIMCKNKDVEKFEHIFVFDKESTAFNPFVARNLASPAIMFKTNNFTAYNGVPITSKGERSIERMLAVAKLIADGKMPKKYIKFIDQISGLDYEQLAKEVFEDTGIKVDQRQIDMYKFGSECAGNIVLRNMER